MITAARCGTVRPDPELPSGSGLGHLGAALVFLAFFPVVVTLQLRSRRYPPAIFWLVVLSTSIVGTAVSDLMDREVGRTGRVSSAGIGTGPAPDPRLTPGRPAAGWVIRAGG